MNLGIGKNYSTRVKNLTTESFIKLLHRKYREKILQSLQSSALEVKTKHISSGVLPHGSLPEDFKPYLIDHDVDKFIASYLKIIKNSGIGIRFP